MGKPENRFLSLFVRFFYHIFITTRKFPLSSRPLIHVKKVMAMGKKQNRRTAAEVVQIYGRRTGKGTTLYLHYSLNGRQRRENTGLRLTGDPTGDDVALRAARILQAKKVTEIMNGKAGTELETPNNPLAKARLVDFIRTIAEEKEKDSTKRDYINVAYQLDEFTNIRLCDVGKAEIKRFLAKFAERLSPGSVRSYAAYLNSSLEVARRRGIIPVNPYRLLENDERPKPAKTKRDYLTEEELGRLMATPPKREAEAETLDAFLFSSLTGLRFSDVRNLRAEDFEESGGSLRLKKDTQKTGALANFALPAKAERIARERIASPKGKDGRLFRISDIVNDHLRDLSERANITGKRVTFHTARHTFATLLITKGASLFAVSKLLGHTNIETTQIYAELVGKKKDEAIGLLNDL